MIQYRTYDAWKCYEIARNLNSESSGLLEIEKIEEKLRDNYEFFNTNLIFRHISDVPQS